jgi:hypothetical protein
MLRCANTRLPDCCQLLLLLEMVLPAWATRSELQVNPCDDDGAAAGSENLTG